VSSGTRAGCSGTAANRSQGTVTNHPLDPAAGR
jgi:hypothetical protein